MKDLGCVWVIVGHSERREGFQMGGEPADICATKCKIAIDAGIESHVCDWRKEGRARKRNNHGCACVSELQPLVAVLSAKDWESVAIAYEPVWAIGTVRKMLVLSLHCLM